MLEKPENNIILYNNCPTCKGRLIGDYDKGELVCSTCGFVLEDNTVDIGPEWKALNLEDKEKKVRVGSPRTQTLHDYGLSTEIGPRPSTGEYVDASYNRIKKWQTRLRTSNPGERGLSNVLTKITEVCNNLDLPRNITETSAHIYRNTLKQKFGKNKSILGMTSASIYLACRKCGVSRTITEIAKAAGIEKKQVSKYFRLILRETDESYIPHPSINKYISKISNKGKFKPYVERLALKLSSEISDSKFSSGKTPAGLAAAYLYIAVVLTSQTIPQKDISDYAEVTEVTVRNRCKEIIQNFTITHDLLANV